MQIPSADDVFSVTFRVARQSNELSQADVAEAMTRAGFDFVQSTVGKIERGERRVSIGEAAALARIVQRSLLDLTSSRDTSSASRRQAAEGIASRLTAQLAATRSNLDEVAIMQRELGAAAAAYDRNRPDTAEPFDESGEVSAVAFFAPLRRFSVNADWKIIDAFRERYGTDGMEWLHSYGD